MSREDPTLKAKADTVFSQADKDGSNQISLEEFIQLAARFPNLVLPDFEQRDAKGNIVATARSTGSSRVAATGKLSAPDTIRH